MTSNTEQRDRENSSASGNASDKPATGGESLLTHLRDQLQELRQRFDATDAQIAGYLREQSTTSQDGTGPGNQGVLEALKKMAEDQKVLAGKIVNTLTKRISEELNLMQFQKIVHETLVTEWDRREAQAASKPTSDFPPLPYPQAEPQPNQQPQTDAPPVSLSDSGVDIPMEDLAGEEDDLSAMGGVVNPSVGTSVAQWSRAVWGTELVETEGFAPFLADLNQRLLAGDRGVSTLAGQLLVYRQTPSEAKPQLLKDVGEAFYRIALDESLPRPQLEQAVIRWLVSDCEQAGLPNTIEVVHPGERFDKSRHSSTTRGGAEVAEVFGWIVLTEGGRVYTRASVAAQ